MTQPCAMSGGRHQHPPHPPCAQRRHSRPAAQRGFSLLEVLVAFSIMAIALGLLYQVAGSNARTTSELMGQEQAMTLAESLLAANAVVPPEGVSAQGQSQGFGWQVRSAPFATPLDASNPQAPKLHDIEATVRWLDGTRERTFALRSLRPERLNKPGEAIR